MVWGKNRSKWSRRIVNAESVLLGEHGTFDVISRLTLSCMESQRIRSRFGRMSQLQAHFPTNVGILRG